MMNPKKDKDNQFSSFAMGATVGVVAALLFGTEEGRKIVKEVLAVIPEKYKKVPEIFISKEEHFEPPHTPIIMSQETPHHTTYDFEPPPPPPPVVHTSRPL